MVETRVCSINCFNAAFANGTESALSSEKPAKLDKAVSDRLAISLLNSSAELAVIL